MPYKRKRKEAVPYDPDDQSRPIRPRPLPYDEQLRVWKVDDPEFEKFHPGLAQWAKARIAEARVAKAAAEAKSGNQEYGLSFEIKIPGFAVRELADQKAQASQEGKELNEQAYIRHIEKTQEELEDQVEYDLDSDDDEWLQKRQKKGLKDLDPGLLERLIDRFEKVKHAVLHAQQSQWETAGPRRSKIAPEEKDPGILYPASTAIKDFGDDFDSLTIRAAHNYWAQKAAKGKTPLLQCFWFDKRWARQNAVKTRREVDSEDESDEGIPFQGKEAPRRAKLRGRQLSREDIRARLFAARADLEVVRTLADQVKRREKVRKRYLIAWQQELTLSLSLAGRDKTATTAPKTTAAQKKVNKPKNNKTPVSRSKKVSFFEPQSPKHEDDTKQIVSPRSGGIVSAVVDSLRRLSSWGRPKNADDTAADVALQEDKESPADAEILADLGMPGNLRGVPQNKPQGQKSKAKPRAQASAKGGRLVAKCSSAQKQAKAQTVDSLTGVVPVPVGFAKVEGRTKKDVQWTAKCKAGSFTLKSTLEIQRFLQEHASGRPQWKILLQQPLESSTSYRQRLREQFPFTNNAQLQTAQAIRQSILLKQLPTPQGSPTLANSREKKIIKVPAAKGKKPAVKQKVVSTKQAAAPLESRPSTMPIKRQTRSGAVFSEVLQTPGGPLREADAGDATALDILSNESDESSSGSDTCLAPDGNNSDSDLEAVKSPLRPPKTRMASASKPRGQEPLLEKSDDEGGSDMSSYAGESDVPTLFSDRDELGAPRRSQLSKKSAGVDQRKTRGIVAAARRRAQAAKRKW